MALGVRVDTVGAEQCADVSSECLKRCGDVYYRSLCLFGNLEKDSVVAFVPS